MPAKKTTILAADDDPQILRLIARNLQLEDYDVVTATDGQEALERLEAQKFDLAILDVMMPKLDGFAVCARVREFSSVPIIMVTARGQDQDKIHGLDLGADDYLTKPFGVEELLARVRAVLRRTQWGAIPLTGGIKRFGDLEIDLEGHIIRLLGMEVRLSPIEFGLLQQLVTNAGKVLTHRMLLQRVWGPEYGGEAEYLRVYINRLRQKLEPDPANPRYFLTEPGMGYRFVAPEIEGIHRPLP